MHSRLLLLTIHHVLHTIIAFNLGHSGTNRTLFQSTKVSIRVYDEIISYHIPVPIDFQLNASALFCRNYSPMAPATCPVAMKSFRANGHLDAYHASRLNPCAPAQQSDTIAIPRYIVYSKQHSIQYSNGWIRVPDDDGR